MGETWERVVEGLHWQFVAIMGPGSKRTYAAAGIRKTHAVDFLTTRCSMVAGASSKLLISLVSDLTWTHGPAAA